MCNKRSREVGPCTLAGPAQLMNAFTNDNQVRQELLDDRDKRYSTSTSELRGHRQAAVQKPENKAAGADCWEGGPSFQTRMEEVDLKREHEAS